MAAVAAVAPGFGHGIDITDEGLYLVAADAPDPSYTYVGLWGDYLHPLFALVRYDIALYRALGAVLLALSALVCANGLRRMLTDWGVLAARGGRSRTFRIALDLAVGAGALVYYALYLITPSYNWLALVGILICAGGLLPTLGRERSRSGTWRDSALLSLGAFLAFMGRPTTGVGLALLAALMVLAVSVRPMRQRLAALLAAAAVGIVLIGLHLVFVLNWSGTANAFSEARYFTSSDVTTHSLSGLLRQSLDQIRLVPAGVWHVAGPTPLLGLAVLLVAFVPATNPERRRRLGAAAALAAFAGCASTVLVRGGFGGGPHAARTLPFSGLALMLTAGLALAAAALVLRAEPVADPGPEPELGRPRLRALAIGAFFLLAALLYAFSSNNGLIFQMHGAFLLLGLGAFSWLLGAAGARAAWATAMVFALVCGVAGVSSVREGAEFGYRTAPPAESTATSVVSHRAAELDVGPAYAAFYRDLAAAAQTSGFAQGTPLVDLTPFSPGVGYALGSTPPTTLMLGFSPTVVRWALAKQEPLRWHGAWLLLEPKGRRHVDPAAVVGVLGRSFPADYEQVATLVWPFGDQSLELWRPRNP